MAACTSSSSEPPGKRIQTPKSSASITSEKNNMHTFRSTSFLLALATLAVTAFITTHPAAEQRIRLERSESALLVQTSAGSDWVTLARYNMALGARPYLHPVKDPLGQVTLTDNKPADHPWQHGIFTGFHGVNGFNYWKEDQGQQRFIKLLRSDSQNDKVSWTSLIELVDPAGKIVLEEENTI